MRRWFWSILVCSLGCSSGDIGDYAGNEADAPGRVIMKVLGQDVRALHRLSATVDEGPATVDELRHRAAEIERRLELCRKMNQSPAFLDNLTRSVVAAGEVADAAADPVARQQAVLRLERTCTRCHTRLW